MGRMKGGYQMIDLSSVTVGTQTTIAGIYDKATKNNKKPYLIKTPDGQDVFAEAKAGTNKMLTSYLGADGSTYTVEITKANKVTITKQESSAETDARLDDLEARLDGADTGKYYVDLSSYDGSTAAKIYTCPTDGYVEYNATSANTLFELCARVGSSGRTLMISKAIDISQSVFVRKGTKVYINHNEGTAATVFFLSSTDLS